VQSYIFVSQKVQHPSRVQAFLRPRCQFRCHQSRLRSINSTLIRAQIQTFPRFAQVAEDPRQLVAKRESIQFPIEARIVMPRNEDNELMHGAAATSHRNYATITSIRLLTRLIRPPSALSRYLWRSRGVSDHTSGSRKRCIHDACSYLLSSTNTFPTVPAS